MTENEKEEPFTLDMDVVEDQLKAVSPEQLEELAKRVNAKVEQQRPPQYSNMSDGEFAEARRKAGV
jgi:hypothetical protein